MMFQMAERRKMLWLAYLDHAREPVFALLGD
jgi:hypothetical protein